MNLRKARKIRSRIVYSKQEYRGSTVTAMRRQLHIHELIDDSDLWWCELLGSLERESPTEFAAMKRRMRDQLELERLGIKPLTDEEIERIVSEVEPEPISEEEIDRIVDRVINEGFSTEPPNATET